MPRHRHALPQLQDELFLADGGIETTLMFHDKRALPEFAAFPLLRTRHGRALLRRYYRRYVEVAQRFSTGLVLESATWRASADWGRRLGCSVDDLRDANRRGIELLEQVRQDADPTGVTIVVSGCIGPRADGYRVGHSMPVGEAEDYHGEQIGTFAGTGADMVCALTMTNAEEAIGIALAARRLDMPVALSFTVDTTGRLPTGQPLPEAIEQVDDATARHPAYFMINCAHPSHFGQVLLQDGPWRERLRGLRANASSLSHEELDGSPRLDDGDPVELGRQYAELKRRAARLNVLGGCCGTDHRHVGQIARACRPLFPASFDAG